MNKNTYLVHLDILCALDVFVYKHTFVKCLIVYITYIEQILKPLTIIVVNGRRHLITPSFLHLDIEIYQQFELQAIRAISFIRECLLYKNCGTISLFAYI